MVKKAEKALVACYSFKGHDFEKIDRHAKRVTKRAARRLNKALTKEES